MFAWCIACWMLHASVWQRTTTTLTRRASPRSARCEHRSATLACAPPPTHACTSLPTRTRACAHVHARAQVLGDGMAALREVFPIGEKPSQERIEVLPSAGDLPSHGLSHMARLFVARVVLWRSESMHRDGAARGRRVPDEGVPAALGDSVGGARRAGACCRWRGVGARGSRRHERLEGPFARCVLHGHVLPRCSKQCRLRRACRRAATFVCCVPCVVGRVPQRMLHAGRRWHGCVGRPCRCGPKLPNRPKLPKPPSQSVPLCGATAGARRRALASAGLPSRRLRTARCEASKRRMPNQGAANLAARTLQGSLSGSWAKWDRAKWGHAK